MRLTKDIYELRAIELAPKFLGMELCRRLLNGEVIRQKITETEIYYGEDDTACHAHKERLNELVLCMSLVVLHIFIYVMVYITF